MCWICTEILNEKVKPYDASLMAGEFRMQIGEEHYKEIIELIKKIEEQKAKIDWDLISDFELDFHSPYLGNYGDNEE